MAETLSRISIISFIIAFIALGIAIFLWFFLKISNVIGELSGRTARRAIERVRKSNERSGEKYYGPSQQNIVRGKITDTMLESVTEQQTELMKMDKDTEPFFQIENNVQQVRRNNKQLVLLEEILLVHTDKTIE